MLKNLCLEVSRFFDDPLDYPHVVQDTVDGKVYARMRGVTGMGWTYLDLAVWPPRWRQKCDVALTFESVDDAIRYLEAAPERQRERDRINHQPDTVVARFEPPK